MDQPAQTPPPSAQAGSHALRVLTPPGYDSTAARSTLRRYPRQLRDALRPVLPGVVEFSPGWLESLRDAPLGAVWLGHATVLLRMAGQWIVTDPVFSQRIGVRIGPLTLGVPRLLPTIDPAGLPRADLILLSHAHFDHFDLPTLRAMRSPSTRVITARRTGRLAPRGFGLLHELDWDESLEVGPLRIMAVRPKHWGARTIWDKHRGYNSYVLASDAHRVLYAGDTAFFEGYQGLGPFDLTIFGIGAYDPWIHAHASPEQAWQMHQTAGGGLILPMHHSTFELSDEPLDDPMRRLLAVAADQHDRVICREMGQLWRSDVPNGLR